MSFSVAALRRPRSSTSVTERTTSRMDEARRTTRVSTITAPGWLMPLEYGFIFLYFTLFELGGSTPGKRIFRLTVTMDDGTRPTSIAVVVRNLIRIPEMYLLYAPSAIACLASSKNKRLGDLAAKTVVVRRGAAPHDHGLPRQ